MITAHLFIFRQYLKAFPKQYYNMRTRKWREREREREGGGGGKQADRRTECHTQDLKKKGGIVSRPKLNRLLLFLRLIGQFYSLLFVSPVIIN